MHTGGRLGLTHLPAGNLNIKEALLNTQKTSEVVKSEIQLSRMTNLLNTINTENNYLSKQLLKLSNENKELKKALGTRAAEKKAVGEWPIANQTQYDRIYGRKGVCDFGKPVAVDHSLVSGRPIGESNYFDPPTFRQDRINRTQQIKSTQTSPSRSRLRPSTNEIAIATDRTPEKLRGSPKHHQNPENTEPKKVQRALSMHRINPSSSAGLREHSLKSSQSGEQTTPIRPNKVQRESNENGGKKRYLRLVSLQK